MARASMNWLIRYLRMQVNDSVPIALDDEYYFGDTVKLSNDYNDLDGDLTDPVSPTITITDPNGTVTVSAATPDQESTGVYIYYYAPTEIEGYWKVEFGGTVETYVTSWPMQQFRVFVDGGKYTWTDNELQTILDANRTIIRRERLRNDVDQKQFYSERKFLEGSLVTWDNDDTIIKIWDSDAGSASAASPDSWNLTDGIFVWTAAQNNTLYLDAKSYNMHGAIADCMDQLAMDRTRATAWTRGGVSYTYNDFRDIAKDHRSQAGAKSTKIVRTYRTER